MGKNTINNKKKKLAKARKKAEEAKKDLSNWSTEQLLTKAQEEIECFQYEAAQKLCQEALARDPDHVPALETSASLCLETGNLEGAKHCLGRAITLAPHQGHAKYLSMAQLLQGHDAAQCYVKGVELLTAQLANTAALDENTANTTPAQGDAPGPSTAQGPPEDTKAALRRKISTAFCSMAELYMTDLCDEEAAEATCQDNIQKAQEADPTNPEAFQMMASFLLVKEEVEEARRCIKQSVDLWLPKYKQDQDQDQDDENPGDPVDPCPLPYSTRLSTARILIEVEEHELAADVLDGLSEEDDEVVDTWYLLGWSSYLQGDEHKEDARHYFHRAKKVHEVSPSEDEQLVEHLEELVQELGPVEDDDEDDDFDEEAIMDALQRDSDDEDDVEAEEGMDTS